MPAQDTWGRIQWLWDRPPVKRLRITISMAQWTVRLPALLALVATQVPSSLCTFCVKPFCGPIEAPGQALDSTLHFCESCCAMLE